ncbi:unnamed protein product [Schistosoma margrebowiei]|uniref:Uncharacterized protein n=1 Tax=Schistosoma margrebowiei TaxID=48269 RepID=A0A183MS05_9TREM|nr:unnamed protein product [Schistosoma margrebowiei]
MAQTFHIVRRRWAKQELHIYNRRTSGTQNNYQPTSMSGSSIQVSRQFYCSGQKLGQLRKSSSRKYKCLLTAVYAKHFGSVDQTLSPTTYCGKNKSDLSGGSNREGVLQVDRTHIEESTQVRYKVSPHLESSRPKEKRKTKELNTTRNGDRYEKNEQALGRIRKEGPG